MHTRSANLNVNVVLHRGMLTLAVTINAAGIVKGALFWGLKSSLNQFSMSTLVFY